MKFNLIKQDSFDVSEKCEMKDGQGNLLPEWKPSMQKGFDMKGSASPQVQKKQRSLFATKLLSKSSANNKDI